MLGGIWLGSVLLTGTVLSPLFPRDEPQANSGSPPQVKSRSGAGASEAAGKIKVVDATPEDALRTFMLAVLAQDRAAVQAVTLPNPDRDWLLKGQPVPPEAIKDATAQFARLPIKRLRAGEKVALPKGRQYVVAVNEVAEDRVVLLPQGAPVPTRLWKVESHWKVAADPFIAAGKAADAAMKKAEADKAASKR
jgi:hypothetical protein